MEINMNFRLTGLAFATVFNLVGSCAQLAW
ncbi:Uncharacterised protein [Serratia fonticola]|uniref:Uncharacterized protein n=1 Tax=Serratia fonticola TaxID=47917 RepID=A0A4U9VP39_SERFO|nr:Uncharacterised protein [Serratia fonticola]